MCVQLHASELTVKSGIVIVDILVIANSIQLNSLSSFIMRTVAGVEAG